MIEFIRAKGKNVSSTYVALTCLSDTITSFRSSSRSLVVVSTLKGSMMWEKMDGLQRSIDECTQLLVAQGVLEIKDEMDSPMLMGQPHVLESSIHGMLSSFLINLSTCSASFLHQQLPRFKQRSYFSIRDTLTTSNYYSDNLNTSYATLSTHSSNIISLPSVTRRGCFICYRFHTPLSIFMPGSSTPLQVPYFGPTETRHPNQIMATLLNSTHMGENLRILVPYQLPTPHKLLTYNAMLINPTRWSGRFLDIIGWDPNICKTYWFHVDIFGISDIVLRYGLEIPLKWSVIFLQSWTSTGSCVINCRLAPITNFYRQCPDQCYQEKSHERYCEDGGLQFDERDLNSLTRDWK